MVFRPYGLPRQTAPRIEVVSVSELNLFRSVVKGKFARLGGKSFLRSRQEFGQVLFQTSQAEIADGREKGSGDEFTIHNDAIGKTGAELGEGPGAAGAGRRLASGSSTAFIQCNIAFARLQTGVIMTSATDAFSKRFFSTTPSCRWEWDGPWKTYSLL